MNSARILITAKRFLISVPLLLAIVYAGDYVWLRIRISYPDSGPALGTVQFYWATSIKGGREEIFFDQPQTETCVRSLFPHFGQDPCWYSSRKTVRVIR